MSLPTPYWTSPDGRHVLYNQNCLDVLPHLTGVDAVVTDPPYDVGFMGKRTKHTCATHESSGGYVGGDSRVGVEACRMAMTIAKRGVVFPGNRLLFEYDKPYEFGCVYCPSGAGLGRWGFTVVHPMLFYGMGLPHTRQSPAGFSSFETVDDCEHPCPKPVGWMIWAINKCSIESQTILDPFTGSGTTGVACIRTGRRFIGIELEPKYCAIARERMERELSQPCLPTLEPTKATQEVLL